MNNFFNYNIRIALDIDEVLADFIGGYKKHMGITDKVTNFNFSYATGEIVKNLPDSFWLSLKPKIKPSDINFLPIAYVSKRHFDENITKTWIETHGFPCLPIYHIKEGSKIHKVLELDVDYFVDDHILNYQELTSVGIKTFLMDCEHNKQFDVGSDRLYDIKELVDRINKQINK